MRLDLRPRSVVESVFREESPRILASLIRRLGDFDSAEEALQEAFVSALKAWEKDGIPENPSAWISTTAWHRALDGRRKRHRELERFRLSGTNVFDVDELAESEMNPSPPEESDQLRLIFTCCHPALRQESQVALTLKTLGGLSTLEIARAFLLPESTMAQRIVRAKKKIREARIPYSVPGKDRLPERLPSVLSVIYLIFGEGYSACSGDELMRQVLCGDAIRLGRMLLLLMPAQPEVEGLLALMLLHDSRSESRVDIDGAPILLEDQDRSLWSREKIDEGIQRVEHALSKKDAGFYQIQAAIAAVHAEASQPRQTDWEQIVGLYDELFRIAPTPVVALNRAVAVAMAFGPDVGLERLEDPFLSAQLDGYLYFHSAKADLLRRMDRSLEARNAYERALALATNRSEIAFLHRRLGEVSR